jgi:hypothetical protein
MESVECNQDQDTGYGMEIKIPLQPLKEFGPDNVDVLGSEVHVPLQNWERFRANLFYTSTAPAAEDPGNDGARVNYSWAPITVPPAAHGADFHETSIFGFLVFADTVAHGGTDVTVGPIGALKPKSMPLTLSGSSTFALSLPEPALPSDIAIFDISGKCVARAGTNGLSVNGSTVSWNGASSVPAGFYVLKVAGKDFSEAQRIFIQK